MAFSDRLNKAIVEMEGGMMDAASTVELAKQHQRVRIIERAADQAVKALEQIQRILKAPDYKGDTSFDAMAAQIDNMITGLDKDGNMRRSMSSLLTLPPEIST
jgi:predicted xylose isomerase-like sugar epimerase